MPPPRSPTLAKAKNVPVISYDRLIKGTDAVNYYISFDNEQVGKLQGTSLLTALERQDQPDHRHDQRLADRQQRDVVQAGAHSVLDGKVNIAKEYDTPDWSPDKAQNEMQQALTALGNKVDGVLRGQRRHRRRRDRRDEGGRAERRCRR